MFLFEIRFRSVFFSTLAAHLQTHPNRLDNIMKAKEYGTDGEQIAVNFLESKGYAILDRNWHCGHKELDIVAKKEDTLVIIEVKRRANDRYGNATDAITDQKIRCIVAAAGAYVKRYCIDLEIRFDVIAITGTGNKIHIEHIENAFFAPLWN